MERSNRKSQLAPPLSPATQALLRGEPSASPSKDSSASSRTPTSGDIPIREDTKSSRQPDPPAARAPSAETNGAPRVSSQSSGPERPFPPRTSSNSLFTPGRQRESGGFNTANAAQIRSPGYNPAIPPSRSRENESFGNLPIRPPPSGPLPAPPGSSPKYAPSRRSGTNGHAYPNSEVPPH